MTVVAGIDEAGYGPTLGPLVVCATAYRLEDGARERDLDRLVGVRGRTLRLPVADSKRLYGDGGSLARIEATTLGYAALGRGALPLRVAALLDGAVGFGDRELDGCPWYGDGTGLLRTPLPRASVVDEVLEGADHDRDVLARRGAEFLDLFIAPVEVARFNRLTNAAGSKAYTLFYATGCLIQALVQRYPDDDLVIHVDRQGGRIHYGDLLQTFFPLAPLTVRRERPHDSLYELDWPARSPVRIDFRVKADGSRAPVALASVVAKTVRELFMGCLNEWFGARVPELRRTAGYGPDARRFLDDVAPALREQPRLRERLVRCR